MMLRACLVLIIALTANRGAWAADPHGKPDLVDVGSFASALDGWRYYGGWEFKGATGGLTWVHDAGHDAPGAARLTGDFSAGGAYVAMTIANLNVAACEFAYWVKPDGIARTMSVRLTDEQGQTFQYLVRLAMGGDWQRVAIIPGTTVAEGHFGKVKDGVWKGQVTAAAICIGKHDCTQNNAGACLIDDITITKAVP